jgi:hypothetical protein
MNVENEKVSSQKTHVQTFVFKVPRISRGKTKAGNLNCTAFAKI